MALIWYNWPICPERKIGLQYFKAEWRKVVAQWRDGDTKTFEWIRPGADTAVDTKMEGHTFTSHKTHIYETNGSMCLVVGKSLVSASTVDAWCPGRDGKCQVTETPRRKYTKLQQSGTRGYVTRTVSLLLTPVTCKELAVVTHSIN